MSSLLKRLARESSEITIRWEVKKVEFTRLAGEQALCARGRVLTAPFRGTPLRVFFVPREESLSTWGYIRCSKVGGEIELPPTVVLGGRPQFLTELEPLFEFHPEERLILEFQAQAIERRSNGEPILQIMSVAIHSSMRSADIGISPEAMH